LERIELNTFVLSGLKSILIPSSVVVLGEDSFQFCASLESVLFESDSRLKRIEESMFRDSRISFQSVSREFANSKKK
jgi:hypothetical protein